MRDISSHKNASGRMLADIIARVRLVLVRFDTPSFISIDITAAVYVILFCRNV
jgi:hypothetical protein